MNIQMGCISFKRYNPYEYKKIVEDIRLRKESNYGVQRQKERQVELANKLTLI